ncbi:MAG: phosphopantetheine-binding protein [Solirubrobacteraceae bacterium]
MSSDLSGEAALRIARFILSELDYQGTVVDLIGGEPVRLTEAIDSVALLELATFVEDDFGVQIEDHEIVPENFTTVADLVRLINEKVAFIAPSAGDGEDQQRGRL